MTKRVVVLLLVVAVSSGCSAYDRLGRLRVELEDDVRRGRMGEAAMVEDRMLLLSSRAYGEASHDDVEVRAGIAESWAQWKHTGRAVEMAEQTLAGVEQRFGEDPEALAPALLSLTKIYWIARHWTRSEAAADRVSALCRGLYSRVDPPPDRFGNCMLHVRHDVPGYHLAAGAYPKWAEGYLLSDELTGEKWNREGGISKLTVLGRGYAENGAYPEASWYLQNCVDELRPRYERPVPSSRTVWRSDPGDVEVVVLDSAHSFESQSPRCLEDLIDVRRKLGNDQSANSLAAWQRESWARGPDLEKDLARRVSFADHAWHDDFLTSRHANNLAFYYAGKGRTADAIRAYEEAIRYIDRALARDGVFAGVYPARLLLDELFGLGAAYEQAGRFADAQAVYRRAAGIAASELHPRHAWRLESLARLARSQNGGGLPTEAETTWRNYLEVAQRIRGTDHADYALGLAGLADALAASGRGSEATGARARAASIRKAYAQRIASTRDLPLPVALRSPPSPAN